MTVYAKVADAWMYSADVVYCFADWSGSRPFFCSKPYLQPGICIASLLVINSCYPFKRQVMEDQDRAFG
jgi:hypothetical protein